jgi:hypothetical protein
MNIKEDEMALYDWNESYSVGVKTMDDQHKKLIGMINQLHDAMKEGKGSSEIGSVLSGYPITQNIISSRREITERKTITLCFSFRKTA